MAETKEDLKRQADELGLEVRRQDGRDDLEPTAADYQHALGVASGALLPDSPAGTTSKTFEVIGAFSVLDVEPGGTIEVEVEPDGVVRDAHGRPRANVTLLLEQGAIREEEGNG